jgi:hypothetical protein
MLLLIPQAVGDDENIVRIIFHPLHYSNSKNSIKREAFLPPEGKKDVSLIRLSYSSENRCKKIAKTINLPSGKYVGLSVSTVIAIRQAIRSQSPLAGVDIFSSPLTKVFCPGKFSNFIIIISYKTPEHADLKYPISPKRGEPNTELRVLANEIKNMFKFYKDPEPLSKCWRGGKLAL